LIWLEEWLGICAIFFRDGIDEMMRDACCFVILFLVNSQLHFSKDVSKSNPSLYSIVSLIWASKYPILHMNAHKNVNSMTPKSGVIIDLYDQSLHPFWPPLLQLANLGPHKNRSTACLVQQLILVIHCPFFYHSISKSCP
jgi:hypothetical protein